MTTLKHIYLVDGSGYIFRAYHGIPAMTRSDGVPVNAVYGYTTMLLKLLEDKAADHIAVIFDAKRENFRNEIYADYKANRDDPPEDLIPQFQLIRDATEALNVPCLEKEGFEADDLIATYARECADLGAEVTIVSSDKDLMQLVTDQVTMWDPMKNRRLGPDEVVEKFGVDPAHVVDVQALAGDASDNVPGVPGIGVKTAAQLITEFGDLEALLAGAETISQPKRRQSLIEGAENARISKKLVTLDRNVPDLPPLDALEIHEIDTDKFIPFLQQNEFKSILARFESRLESGNLNPDAVSGAASGVKGASPSPQKPVYELVTTEEALKKVVAEIYASGECSFDTETDALNPRAANLVGICLAASPGKAYYVPVGHVAEAGDLMSRMEENPADNEIQQIPLQKAVDFLKPMLEDPGIIKIAQNAKYDYGIMSRYGVQVAPLHDTMLMSYVLSAGKNPHNMDFLADHYLGHTTIKFKDVVGRGKNQKTFAQISPEDGLDYAAEDAEVTLRLYHILRRQIQLEKLNTVYETIERPLIPVISQMEQSGVKVDALFLQDLSKDFATRMADIEASIYEIAGQPFNIASPKQLGEILFDELGIDMHGKTPKKTKSGAYQTGVDVLEKLADEHPIARLVLDWRQLSKLKSTYSEALVQQIVPESKRVHTSYSMAATTTGRFASSDPNLQNIPIRTEEGRKIRRAFISEPKHKLIAADYSQIELRLLAHVGDVKGLKQAFNDGVDIHAYTASLVFGVPVEGMDPMVRRNAKAINFGIIYGISPYGLAKNLSIDPKDAKEFIAAYFRQFPEIEAYMEARKEEAKHYGYVTTIFGRRCHTPEINDKNPMRRGYAERAAINAPLQGANADIIKRAMARLPKALQDEGLDAKMLLQVHDELVFEAPEDQAEKTLAVAKRVMESAHAPAVDLSVPLLVEGNIADNWSDAH